MRGRIRTVGAAAAIATITWAAAAEAVSEDFTVAAGATGGASPACADGKRATGGGYRSETSSWTHRAMNPQGRKFRVSLHNETSSVEQSARAIGLCARKDPLSAVNERITFDVVQGVPVEKTLRARCPRGTKLAGGGFSVTSPEIKGTDVLETRPIRARSWRVRTTQSTGGAYALRVRAICDSRKSVTYRPRREALSDLGAGLRRRGLSTVVIGTLEPRCRSGERVSAGGFASLGEIRPRWAAVAPAGGGYDATFRYGYSPGNEPEGDLVGYALCRS